MRHDTAKKRRRGAAFRAELSVLTLACRRSIYKALAVSLICCAAQAAVFFAVLGSGAYDSPEAVFSAAHIGLIGAAGFAALCAALGVRGAAGSSKQDYTLRRLGVSPRRMLMLDAAANGMMLLIFWAMQALTLLSLCQEYTVLRPEQSSVQTVFLAFYRSPYLHGLLPMADVGRWLRDIVLLPGLAVCLACFSSRRRRGHWGIAAPFLIAVCIFTFPSEIGATGADVAVLLLTLCVTGGAVYGLWGDEDEESAS